MCLKIHLPENSYLHVALHVNAGSENLTSHFPFLPTPFQPGFCRNKYSQEKQAMGELNAFKANHGSYSDE